MKEIVRKEELMIDALKIQREILVDCFDFFMDLDKMMDFVTIETAPLNAKLILVMAKVRIKRVKLDSIMDALTNETK